MNNTTIEAFAGAGHDQVSLTIGGQYRWRTAAIQIAHPGGAAGTYDVVVASPNNAANQGAPAGGSSFGLAIVASGGAPGGVDRYRKVGELDWSGAQITALRQIADRTTGAKLADDVIAAGGAVTATRQPGGGFLLGLADDAATEEKLSDQVAAVLGVSKAGVVRRGRTAIAAEESRTNAAYGLLATPDRVQNVVVPAGALVCVAYSALWKDSVNLAGRAAIFIGGQQLQIANQRAGPADGFTTQAAVGPDANQYGPLVTAPFGLVGASGPLPFPEGLAGWPTSGAALGFVEMAASANNCRTEIGGVVWDLTNTGADAGDVRRRLRDPEARRRQLRLQRAVQVGLRQRDGQGPRAVDLDDGLLASALAEPRLMRTA